MSSKGLPGGYIRLYRRIRENEIWPSGTNEKFGKAEAWIDLLLEASGIDRQVMFREQLIDLKRGDLIFSSLHFSERWRWSRGRVNRFMGFLKKTNSITYSRRDNRFSIVTIINYESYNPPGKTDGTTGSTTDGTTGSTTDGTTSNKRINKEINKEKRRPPLTPPKRGEDIVSQWNEFAKERGLSPVEIITKGSKRERALRARLKEKAFDFKRILRRIDEQPFLLGENEKGWTVTFDWVILPSNYPKILEGHYQKKKKTLTGSQEWLKKQKEEEGMF